VAGHLILAMRDPVVLGRLESLAVRHRLVILDDPAAARVAGTSEAASIADLPITAAAELELPGAIDRIAAWRRRWPEALLAGSIRIPDQELWHGALAAGADLVANRGAFVAQLERAIVARGGGPGIVGNVRRLPVRLMERDGDGLVGRLPDAPGGSIALFRVGDRLCAIRDECPHAGASLADGVLDGTIITCPRHGSQFDVLTGSRERGPSDFPIRTYRVLKVEGVTSVEVPG
jgi:nitrite reductase/ring-hydroxylating ferredoxin subunit